VGQVTAHAEVQSQDLIAWFQDSQHYGCICLCAGVGLYISICYIEDLLSSVDGQLFTLVNDFTATIISTSRIAFRIFVGQNGSHGLNYLQTGKVFRCDQFYAMTLALQLLADDIKYLQISLHCMIL
jgi:hypothetical protein